MGSWHSGSQMARECLLDKVMFQQRLEGISGAGEGFLKDDMWKVSVFCLLYWGLGEVLVLEAEKQVKCKIEIYLGLEEQRDHKVASVVGKE